MYIAVFINAFQGRFEPFGFFKTEGAAEDWIEDMGINRVGQPERSLWSIFEVTQVT